MCRGQLVYYHTKKTGMREKDGDATVPSKDVGVTTSERAPCLAGCADQKLTGFSR